MRVSETIAFTRARYPVAHKNSNFPNEISNFEIREVGNPSPPATTTSNPQIRRPRRRYKTPVSAEDVNSSENLFKSPIPTRSHISVLIPPAPLAPRRFSARLQHPRLPKPGPPCPPSVLTEEDRLRWKEARRQRRLFERDFPLFNRAYTKAELGYQQGVEDPDYWPEHRPDRSPTPGYSTDDSIPEPPSDTELYGLQVKDKHHGRDHSG